jgi:hypothetical protein
LPSSSHHPSSDNNKGQNAINSSTLPSSSHHPSSDNNKGQNAINSSTLPSSSRHPSSDNNKGQNAINRQDNQQFKVFESLPGGGLCGWYAVVAGLKVLDGEVNNGIVSVSFKDVMEFLNKFAAATNEAISSDSESLRPSLVTIKHDYNIDDIREAKTMLDTGTFGPIIAKMCDCRFWTFERGAQDTLKLKPLYDFGVNQDRTVRVLYSSECGGHYRMILPDSVQEVEIECVNEEWEKMQNISSYTQNQEQEILKKNN